MIYDFSRSAGCCLLSVLLSHLHQLLKDNFPVPPLDPEKVKEAEGAVYWGEFPDPPGIPLNIGEDVGVLVAELDREVEFPLTLTLLLRFPDSDPGAEPELFNFTFDEYSKSSAIEEPGAGEE